ncbi:hypothetical protein HHI36_005923 [Cryptolaemus montrouzieri]|uniref:SOCS box domain-containing protein n=1 Tax=Cryptolaemus montrouzieri TaxID=559131 RepID=A0ABD2NVH2_9CUCU
MAHEALMKALESKDIREIENNLAKEEGLINMNQLCANGTSLACAAAKTGDLKILKMISDVCDVQSLTLDLKNKNCPKPQTLNIGTRKNIGYFVLNRDCDENEFGEGPTPEGMEDLQWDTEMNEQDFKERSPSPEEESIYNWYAKILTKTPLYLESPEYGISRLDCSGMNVLHYAVNSNNLEMVEYLLKVYKELNVNQCDSNLASPLHMAVKNGNVEMVKFLLDHGAFVNCRNRDEQTALHIACQNGSSSLIHILLEFKSDIHVLDHEGRNPLILSVINNSEDSLRILLEKGARINFEDDFGFTALRRAVWMNNTNLTRILIEHGARVFESHCLLHLAARNNNLEIIQALGRGGARWDVRDNEGNTPLMIACSRKNLQVAEYLLRNGASPNIVNYINGMSAMHICVQDIREPQCLIQFIDLLVRFEADMNSYSHQCGSVLFYAIILENITGACALIQHGVNINFKDDRAYFDNLSLAKRHGNLELVKMIVYSGFKFSNMISDLNNTRDAPLDPIHEFLWESKTKPMSLRELCRVSIRKSLGKHIVKKIYELPLPSILQRYLTLEIL